MPVKGTATKLSDRIQGRYRIDPKTQCMIWLGAHTSGGYPIISTPGNGKLPIYLHRAAYESVHGPMPTGKPSSGGRFELHHSCFENEPDGSSSRSCINPDHIVLMSSRDHRRLHGFLRRCKREFSKLALGGVFIGKEAA